MPAQTNHSRPATTIRFGQPLTIAQRTRLLVCTSGASSATTTTFRSNSLYCGDCLASFANGLTSVLIFAICILRLTPRKTTTFHLVPVIVMTYRLATVSLNSLPSRIRGLGMTPHRNWFDVIKLSVADAAHNIINGLQNERSSGHQLPERYHLDLRHPIWSGELEHSTPSKNASSHY